MRLQFHSSPTPFQFARLPSELKMHFCFLSQLDGKSAESFTSEIFAAAE
jgi:hypothetical protein